MLEVYQVQMEWVYQDSVGAVGGLSEGESNNTCDETETKMKVAPAS